MAHDRESLEAQRIGDVRYMGGRRGHVPARLRRRCAIAGPVIRNPPDPAPGRSREERIRRRPDVQRPVVPDDDEAGLGSMGAGVVDMQGPPVTQAEIALDHRSALPVLGRTRNGSLGSIGLVGGDDHPCAGGHRADQSQRPLRAPLPEQTLAASQEGWG